MIEHVSIPVKDYAAAKQFYSEALKPLGYELKRDFPEYRAAGFMEGGHTSFWIVQKERVEPMHLAFLATNKDEVHAFHAAALAAGAKDNGAPGPRPDYGPEYYASFIHDADGNNIEAVFFT